MARLRWRTEESSRYSPMKDEVLVSDRDVSKDRGHLVIAHEAAHKREGILTNIFEEPADRTFWKELAVWQSALERGPEVDKEDRLYIMDALSSYLGGVADEFGLDSRQYRECMYGFDKFIKEYL